MSDLRDQLRKAGLVSDKQLRQAKHKERLHASKVGHAGLEAERRERDAQKQVEREERRKADREREQERKRREEKEATRHRLAGAIQRGWIREATSGSRRFYFETRSRRISYLDLSDVAARRLSSGSAAIIESRGAVRGEFCVVADRSVAEIQLLAPETIRFWNEDRTNR